MAANSLSATRCPRNALIVYGSETGNSQDAADELGRITERLWFSTTISELDAANLSNLGNYTIVIFVISTTGQGDLPLNARKFWKSLLRKRLPPNYLQSVNFAIFGLGDSSYPKFNWAARKLHKRLVQLGAREVYPRGEADEQHPEGLDASFLPWSIGLRKYLLGAYPLPHGLSPRSNTEFLEPKWKLRFLEDSNFARPVQINEDRLLPPDHLLPIKGSLTAVLTANKRITPESHYQDVRHLNLSVGESSNYTPGDIVTIYPKNFPKDVDELLSDMGWTQFADRPVEFIPSGEVLDLKLYPPPPIMHVLPYPKLTLRSLLLNYLDITAIPRRTFFSNLAHFTSDDSHKERLLEFTNPELIDELYDYTTRPRRSILEVLQEFSSVNIPFQWAASIFPLLRGRQFSIASGGALKHNVKGNTSIDLLVAIVKYQTVIRKIRQGVCTRYLASLPTGSKLNITVQKGGLNITRAEAHRPVVLVGPGTGVAPMRSLIWERYQWAEQLKLVENGNMNNANGHEFVAKTVLFFGCRSQNADFFYHDDWAKLHDQMSLEVYPAFSRDQREKIYVQDKIREQSKLVYNLLFNQGGIVYICGSSGKMPQAVREALIETFEKEGNIERDQAEKLLMTMEKNGRYKQETW
ncbi:MAG: NAPDH-dependent diflavin reductase [Cirrosporium novae-zelandiae]|nr:MAG: NAPDH-dependent diflavin reductase [Cirrosporium novae-zelandiae]